MINFKYVLIWNHFNYWSVWWNTELPLYSLHFIILFQYIDYWLHKSSTYLRMTEFWLISAPGEKTCQQTWDKLNVTTSRSNNLSTNFKFAIPDLKVSDKMRTCLKTLQTKYQIEICLQPVASFIFSKQSNHIFSLKEASNT